MRQSWNHLNLSLKSYLETLGVSGLSESESVSSTESPEETTSLETDILRLLARINSLTELGIPLLVSPGPPRIILEVNKMPPFTSYLIMVRGEVTGTGPDTGNAGKCECGHFKSEHREHPIEEYRVCMKCGTCPFFLVAGSDEEGN